MDTFSRLAGAWPFLMVLAVLAALRYAAGVAGARNKKVPKRWVLNRDDALPLEFEGVIVAGTFKTHLLGPDEFLHLYRTTDGRFVLAESGKRNRYEVIPAGELTGERVVAFAGWTGLSYKILKEAGLSATEPLAPASAAESQKPVS